MSKGFNCYYFYFLFCITNIGIIFEIPKYIVLFFKKLCVFSYVVEQVFNVKKKELKHVGRG